jgi:hypothetical protein
MFKKEIERARALINDSEKENKKKENTREKKR